MAVTVATVLSASKMSAVHTLLHESVHKLFLKRAVVWGGCITHRSRHQLDVNYFYIVNKLKFDWHFKRWLFLGTKFHNTVCSNIMTVSRDLRVLVMAVLIFPTSVERFAHVSSSPYSSLLFSANLVPISFPESSFPLTSGRKTRALGAAILK